MKIGMGLRNMGDVASRDTVASCACAAEAAGLESLWVFDHLAIPPDDAEGSGGLYLEPLATLAFLAGCTQRIMLGTGVLVIPYRPPLLTAKWLATLQVLSGDRLLLGAAPGWMDAEFRALGVDRRARGRITDETLDFIHSCFAADEVTANGQPFLFRPRPKRPPIYIGGDGPHAFKRTIERGDGWIPIGKKPAELKAAIVELGSLAEEAGKSRPEIATFATLNAEDAGEARATLAAYADAGVDRLVWVNRYSDGDDCRRAIDAVLPMLGDYLD